MYLLSTICNAHDDVIDVFWKKIIGYKHSVTDSLTHGMYVMYHCMSVCMHGDLVFVSG